MNNLQRLVKIRKINNNNRLYGIYKYQIKFGTPSLLVDMRNWAWETYGPSCEYDLFKELSKRRFDPITGHYINGTAELGFNEVWCWQVSNDEYKYCLYIRDDEDLMMFKLRWGLI